MLLKCQKIPGKMLEHLPEQFQRIPGQMLNNKMKNVLLFLIIISIILIITVYNNQPKLNSTLVYLSKYSYNTNDKPNACIIVLLRNQNLEKFIQTIIKIEQNFTRLYTIQNFLFFTTKNIIIHHCTQLRNFTNVYKLFKTIQKYTKLFKS